MKKLKFNFTLVIIVLLFTQPVSWAEVSAPFSNHVLGLVTQADGAFQRACEASSVKLETDVELEFKQFFVGFAATASFGVSDVLDVEVSPEITLIWENSASSDD